MNAENALQTSCSYHPVIVLPYAGEPLSFLAKQVIADNKNNLPDLSQVVILLPDLYAARQLRQILLQQAHTQGCHALLGPHINTLRGWIEHQYPCHTRILNDHARELMLVEALNQHHSLFGETNPWAMTDSMIDLFDDLTQHRIHLTDNLQDFIQQLTSAYGLESGATSALTYEAKVIHTLWRAWHQQQHEEGTIDKQSAYLSQLAASTKTLPSNIHIYLAGFSSLIPAERDWLNLLVSKKQATFITQGNHEKTIPESAYHPDAVLKVLLTQLEPPVYFSDPPSDNFTEFLDTVYAPVNQTGLVTSGNKDNKPEYETGYTVGDSPDLAQRAYQFSNTYPENPCNRRLHIFEAHDAEQEAKAIDIQIRRWLLDGKKHIAIISEDRRLARRIRALLERSHISLQDRAGWALSTTSAAATVERWLEAVEEDFDHQPLLDILKSPFIFPDQDRDTHLETVYRLERDIIFFENIARGLKRYRKHIAYRQHRLPWTADENNHVIQLIDRLQEAAAPLLRVILSGKCQPDVVLDALEESLKCLGLWQTFAQDAAGSNILTEISHMRHALKARKLTLDWSDFRTWLGRTLERSNFCPSSQEDHVQLFSLTQSCTQHFDAIIIAGANAENIPGQTDAKPFFNEHVRHDLGLPLSRTKLVSRFYHFRRLLECAPRIMITRHQNFNDETVPGSPWLEILQTFHELAYHNKLSDNGLSLLVNHKDAQVASADILTIPLPRPYPAPVIRPDLIPQTFSASSYQQLIDCPYQFYAAQCLNIAAPEVIREALEKSDYGERVHRILQIFHDKRSGSSRAFKQAINAETRELAIKALTSISKKEFFHDLEDNFIHRGWLQRWLAHIPDYIDWQIKHEKTWKLHDVEIRAIKNNYADKISLKGRLDRIDKNENSAIIIDYKTGTTPDSQDINNGEAIQLPFYALLFDGPVSRVEYLKLDNGQIKSDTGLEGDELNKLKKGIGQRLKDVVEDMYAGSPLPAWGDEKSCHYCSMQGICRKQAWVII